MRRLTKVAGVDRSGSPRSRSRTAAPPRCGSRTNSLVHSYVPTEVPLTEREFAAEQLIMGTVLTWPTDGGHALLAYEHGSSTTRTPICRVDSVNRRRRRYGGTGRIKGSYLTGQDLRDGFAAVWWSWMRSLRRAEPCDGLPGLPSAYLPPSPAAGPGDLLQHVEPPGAGPRWTDGPTSPT